MGARLRPRVAVDEKIQKIVESSVQLDRPQECESYENLYHSPYGKLQLISQTATEWQPCGTEYYTYVAVLVEHKLFLGEWRPDVLMNSTTCPFPVRLRPRLRGRGITARSSHGRWGSLCAGRLTSSILRKLARHDRNECRYDED